MKIFKCVQLSPDWFKERERRMTASHGQAISANGKGLITYIWEMMSKLYSSAEHETYSNKNMERGIEDEPIAVMLYEFKTKVQTQEVGFIAMDEYTGCSPDRLVGDDGMLEVKCRIDKVYFDFLINRKIPSKDMWQMQMQMQISGRKWCDYVVYNPNFKEQLIIIRVLPDEAKFLKLKMGYAVGKRLITEIEAKYKALGVKK